MSDKKTDKRQNPKAENLKEILKGFGIRTQKELDEALYKALDGLTIGIMTEAPVIDST